TPFSFFERLNEHLKQATNGAASYLGVYRDRSKGAQARLRLVCSSQQLPDGVLAMVNDARREGGVLRDKLQQTLSPLDVSELEEFDLFRTNVRTGSMLKNRRRRPVWPDMSDDGFDVGNASRTRRGHSTIKVATPTMPPESRAQVSNVPKSSLSGAPAVSPSSPSASEQLSGPSHARPSDYQSLNPADASSKSEVG
ncbi:MAG TPA: hypothetical protein VIV60_14130, partial [Polyangiaceae bacterium]